MRRGHRRKSYRRCVGETLQECCIFAPFEAFFISSKCDVLHVYFGVTYMHHACILYLLNGALVRFDALIGTSSGWLRKHGHYLRIVAR